MNNRLIFGYGILIILILSISIFILNDLFFGEYVKDEKNNSNEFYQTYAKVIQKDSRRIYYTYLCYKSEFFYTAISQANFDIGDILPVMVKKNKCEDAQIIMYDPQIFNYEKTNLTKGLVVDTWKLSYPHIWFEYIVDKKKYLKCQYFKDKNVINKTKVGQEIIIR